jgi:hypothetical protein
MSPQFIKMGLGGTGYRGKPGSHQRAAQKRAANRKVLEGYPVTRPFGSIDEVREYLSGDRIICLLCGRSLKALAYHLSKLHDMSSDDYRERYGIPWSYGLSCVETREKLSVATKKNLADGTIPSFEKGNTYNENPGGGRQGPHDAWLGRKQSPEHKAKRLKAYEDYLIRTGKKRPEHVHIETLPCRMCGKDVDQPAAGRKWYCSTRCRTQYYDKKKHASETTCALCGATFTATGSQMRRVKRGLPVYCSFSCRQSANGKKRRTSPAAPETKEKINGQKQTL